MAEKMNQKLKNAVRDKKNYKRYVAVLLCLSLIVGLGTVTILHKEGDALTHKKKVLECSYVAPTGEGYAGYCAHVHNDDCYDKNGQLVCLLPEIQAHYHTDDCWLTEKELVCGLEENAGHVHTDACYATGEELICGLEETEGHTHGHDCYAWYTDLTCGQEEYPAHTHSDECYNWYTDLICGQEEGDEHTHDESCYGPVRGDLICGMVEGPGHTHTDFCYGEVQGDLICGMEECAPHFHTEACHPQAGELLCTLEEGAGAHTHDDSCYREVKKCVCGMEGLHIHNENCYDAEGNLICGQLQLEMHVHNENCFKTVDMTPEEIAALGLEEHYDVIDEAYTWVSAGDPNADVESWNDWNLMFQDLELTGNWNEDLLTVARTQLGYSESTANFAVSSTEARKGYTRYGAWYNIPYGDWCAMFASFCIRWAGIPEEAMPIDCNCQNWISKLAENGMYSSAEYTLPRPGDLVFYDFNRDGIADHVGIVVSIDPENDTLVTIEGNRTNTVEAFTLRLSEACAMGYGLLPVNPVPGEAAVTLMPAQNFEETVGDVTVTVYAPEGAFPANTRMELALVEDEEVLSAAAAAVDEEEIETDETTNRTTTYKKDVKQVRAVDITFYDVNGNEIQPLIPISVNMTGDFLEEVESAEIVHMENNNSAQPVENAEKEENDVSFAADSFSTYVVIGSDKIATEYTLRTNNREDVTFVVSATFGPEAKIPDGAWISITEYKEDSYQFSQAKENVISAKKAENEAFDENGLGLVALDISLLDEFAFPIEPAPGAEIKIGLEMKKIPETVINEEKFAQTLEIQHLNTSAGYTQVETVAGKGNFAFADGGVKAAFTVESFSTFALTWSGGMSTIHWGKIEDGAFTEFDAASLDTSVGSVNLRAEYPGYVYVDAVYYTSEPQTVDIDASTTIEGRTFINDEITKVTGTGNTYSWTAEDAHNNAQVFTIASGSHMYVVYEKPDPGSGGGTPTPIGIDIPTPQTVKTVSPTLDSSGNPNGTSTVELAITGKQITHTTQTGANVIIVYDISQSMSQNITGGMTRLEASRQAIHNLINTLQPGTNDIDLALVTFEQDAETYTFSGSNWTKSGANITNAVDDITDVSRNLGTNWNDGLLHAYNLAANPPDDDATYVIFITDGCPSVNNQNSHNHAAAGTNSTTDACYLTALAYARGIEGDKGASYATDWQTNPRRTITVNGVNANLYGIYTGTDTNNMLGRLIDASGGKQTITATSAQAITDAFKNIAETIVNNLGASGVSTNDGVTELSSIKAEISGAAGAFHYKRRYPLTAAESGSYTYKSDGTTYTVTAAEITAGEDASGNKITHDTTVTPNKYYITIPWTDAPGATFNENGSVTWDLSIIGTAEADVTYYCSFEIWPSQEALDLIANLDNGLIDYDDLDEDVQAQIEETGSGYQLKTNTTLTTSYVYNNNTYTDPIDFEMGEMPLESSVMSVKKDFDYDINDLMLIDGVRFYLKEIAKRQTETGVVETERYYMQDGSFKAPDDPDYDASERHFFDLNANNSWEGSLHIAPGVMTIDGGVVTVLSPGHKFTLEEEILGDVPSYEYEFFPQTVRPMEINGTLTYLVLEDEYYKAAGATTYVIDGETYFVSPTQGKLVGTNAKTAELDITKVITNATQKDSKGQILSTDPYYKESFTYRVTISVPETSDPTGIMGYCFVPRLGQDLGPTRFLIYGYQGDSPNTDTTYTPDTTRFLGDVYGRWNTQVYSYFVRTHKEGTAIIVDYDEDGNFIWLDNIEHSNGYYTISLDMTLKMDEVIRFTNLPYQSKYVIQEIYNNRYAADTGATSAGQLPIDDPSNIAAQGYTIEQVKSVGGTVIQTAVANDTITGTISNPDVRYCKQTYPTMEYKKICPYCHSDNTFLLTGNEYVIKEIEAM